MKTTKILLGLALALICAPAMAQVTLMTDTNGVLRAHPEFFQKNTNALVQALESAGYSPSGTNKVDKTGDTMTGGLAIVGDGVGHFGVGSTNNPAAPLVVMSYDGSYFEMGGGSGGFSGPLSVDSPWLDVADGALATWYIPLAAPSFSTAGTSQAARVDVVSPTGVVALYDSAISANPGVTITQASGTMELGENASGARDSISDMWLDVAAGTGFRFYKPVSIGITNLIDAIAGKQPYSEALLTLSTNGAAGPLTLSATEAPGTSNKVAASTEFVAKAIHNLGGGTGNADTNNANGWSQKQTFAGGVDASEGTNNLGVIRVTAIQSDTAIGQSIGGTGGTNAASAREALGLVIGYDVQAQDPILQDLADLSLSDGDMLLVSGTDLSKIATTAAGRALLTAANAAAQWSALQTSALQSGAYDAGTWDGVTDKAITPDQFRDVIVALPGGSNAITSVTAPLALSNGVLSIDTSGLGGGGSGGFVYILTNSLGSYISSATATNWPIIDTTISSNDLPTAVGKFIEGAFGAVTTNNSGTTSTNYFTVKVNGSTVFRDFAASSASAVNGVKAYAGNFWLIYESTNTASLICFGGSPTAVAAEYGTGDFGINMTAVAFAATNIPVSWSTNLALSIAIESPTTVSTPAANGMRRIFAWMRRDGTNTTAGTGDVVGPASATDGNIATYSGATGKLIQDGGATIASLATEAEVAAGYEPLNANKYQGTNSVLTTLATLNGSALTNLNASNLASGTVSSNRLPAAIALTTIDAGTITATSVTGDGSGLTNLNGSNIASGTVADARIDTAIARTNAPTLHSPTLLTPSLGVASATSLTLGATNVATELALKAPLASPALTGTPTVNSTNIMAEVNGKQALLVNSAGLASALSDETGTGVAAFATAPTFTGATLNGSVVFGQSTLSAHSSVTNFVADPTVAPYQTINADMTTVFTGVRFLHATNVAAGRQTTVLVFAGTNAAVSVALNSQFAFNTNLVSLTTGQVLPVSFYGYGSSPTNVIATLGTIYTR